MATESKTCTTTDEQQYLDLVNRVLKHGEKREDRTGTGTLAIFGSQTRWSLADGVLPLLTTKSVHFKSVVEELLWMISGSTDSKALSDKGVRIWDANGKATGGDLGPVYGFQWRHFGAKYVDCSTDYKGQGVDQLQWVINEIRKKPTWRRIFLSAWNPVDLDKMALPPCHVSYQFYVSPSRGTLSCQMYQRSADLGLGVPFNIASASLLTIMLARVTNLKPGELIHSTGDTHVYLNHVEPLKAQTTRSPRKPPTLIIKDEAPKESIDGFKLEHFVLSNYDPWPAIKMEMSV